MENHEYDSQKEIERERETETGSAFPATLPSARPPSPASNFMIGFRHRGIEEGGRRGAIDKIGQFEPGKERCTPPRPAKAHARVR